MCGVLEYPAASGSIDARLWAARYDRQADDQEQSYHSRVGPLLISVEAASQQKLDEEGVSDEEA